MNVFRTWKGLDGLGTLLKLLGNEEFHFNDPDSFDFVASSVFSEALRALTLLELVEFKFSFILQVGVLVSRYSGSRSSLPSGPGRVEAGADSGGWVRGGWGGGGGGWRLFVRFEALSVQEPPTGGTLHGIGLQLLQAIIGGGGVPQVARGGKGWAPGRARCGSACSRRLEQEAEASKQRTHTVIVSAGASGITCRAVQQSVHMRREHGAASQPSTLVAWSS